MEEKNGERKECADRNERTAAEGEGRKAGCTEEYVWCALLYNFLLCLLNEKTFSKTCLYNSDDMLYDVNSKTENSCYGGKRNFQRRRQPFVNDGANHLIAV